MPAVDPGMPGPIGPASVDDGVCTDIDLPLPGRREGKVRISYALPGNRLLMCATDRLSAFDRFVLAVADKGQVLTELSAWWCAQTADITVSHLRSLPDPNAMIVEAATPLPVEVVVRQALTGSTATALWTQYAAGNRVLYGHRLPEGLVKNALLPAPLITPTTKAAAGDHDRPLTATEVVRQGLVPAAAWEQVSATALALFSRGQRIAAAAGLLLADTKYEFGWHHEGHLLLIDEIHTPDSSRFWEASTYEQRLAAGAEPESLDKEPVRLALAARGFTGAGPIPLLEPAVAEQTSDRYRSAFTRLTGRTFRAAPGPVSGRLRAALARGEIA
ncbi:MAG: phosphoribosylaminoimidazolesuccinocarboxamide synthase [Actinomycetales bacterium]|nr:phosphoribosylaminoimidazolesuccinocarboxamide synthase [Actinomycetales bacterium]